MCCCPTIYHELHCFVALSFVVVAFVLVFSFSFVVLAAFVPCAVDVHWCWSLSAALLMLVSL